MDLDCLVPTVHVGYPIKAVKLISNGVQTKNDTTGSS